MRKSVVKAKLARNEPVLITGLILTDPSVYEMASLMGFDAIWLDMEHHACSVETANNLMRATRVGRSDVMIRMAKGEFMRMGRMLEAGAHGIMYPRCDDAAEAAEAVRWCKFAPMGRRGFDGSGPDQPYCSMPIDRYTVEANRQTWLVAQLEDPRAVDNAEKIAAVEGVDVLFLGPADFSILSGIPGQFDHASLKTATRRIAEAARKAGKHWGMPVGTTDDAKRLLDLGARFIAYGADIVNLKNAFEQIQETCSKLGFRFDNQLTAQ